MRKALGIIAVTLAAGCVFTAGCSSCNGNGKNVAPLASNWYTSTGYRNIQPTFTEGVTDKSEYKEIIDYDVNFKEPSVGNNTYSVKYENGNYHTEFYAVKFADFANSDFVHEDHKAGYEDKKITAYYYYTLFTATVTYKYGSTPSEPLPVNIETKCYFLSVEDELRPLYSKQVIKSPSPAALQATSLSSCYSLFDEIYETFYSYNGNSAITQITDNLNENNSRKVTRGVGGTSNSLFDVTSLDIVIRALVASGLNQTIDLYTPLNSVKAFTLGSSSASIGTDDDKRLIAEKLQKKELYVPAEDEETVGDNLRTTAVTVTSNTELKGVSQTYWFAKVENKRNNTGRATLLKISLPIVFNLGTLEYTIREVSSTLWNG